MLGRRLVATLANANLQVAATTRRAAGRELPHVDSRVTSGVDVRNIDDVLRCVVRYRPTVIVNCAGVVKKRADAGFSELISVNSLFPQQLADVAQAASARLIHLSTDCVFSGERGGYLEADRPDPVDPYGYSKLLGEVSGSGVLTLRTSMIGLEMGGQARNLVEWYLAQTATVQGWGRAVFSGLTTAELSRVLLNVVTNGSALEGIWHLSAEPIDKYDLLARLHDRLPGSAPLVRDDSVEIDRSLDSTRFRGEMGYVPPTWDRMLDELAEEVRERAARGSG